MYVAREKLVTIYGSEVWSVPVYLGHCSYRPREEECYVASNV